MFVQKNLMFENNIAFIGESHTCYYLSGTVNSPNGAAFVGKLGAVGSATFKNCVSAVTLEHKSSAAGFVGIADAADTNNIDPDNREEPLTQRVRMENCTFYGTLGSENTASFVGTVSGQVLLRTALQCPQTQPTETDCSSMPTTQQSAQTQQMLQQRLPQYGPTEPTPASLRFPQQI